MWSVILQFFMSYILTKSMSQYCHPGNRYEKMTKSLVSILHRKMVILNFKQILTLDFKYAPCTSVGNIKTGAFLLLLLGVPNISAKPGMPAVPGDPLAQHSQHQLAYSSSSVDLWAGHRSKTIQLCFFVLLPHAIMGTSEKV